MFDELNISKIPSENPDADVIKDIDLSIYNDDMMKDFAILQYLRARQMAVAA